MMVNTKAHSKTTLHTKARNTVLLQLMMKLNQKKMLFGMTCMDCMVLYIG